MTKEAGKPWIEADADTAEAIDFLEYYGRQMLNSSKLIKRYYQEKILNEMNINTSHLVWERSFHHGTSHLLF
jgi:delta 1-pyrroline-5-carboxylate dehydrogenase